MPANEPTFDVTISIATYDRPATLERTLQSCVDQHNRLGLSYEILITDNHPSGNAEPIAMRFADRLPVRYQRDLTRNMSELRNAGVRPARGRWVAFIDDDEFADPDWLDELMGAARRTGADIIIGPRLAIFASGKAPPYDPKGRYFERVYDLAPDADIALTDPDARPRFGLGTGNSMCRVDTCLRDPEPFDRAFGDAGGEDIEFLMRQHIQGRRLAWAAQARVTEIVPEHRTTSAYRLIRARRESQIYVSIYLAHTPQPAKVRRSIILKGTVQVIFGAIISVVTMEFGSGSRLKARLLLAKGLGKLSWMRPVGYINEARFATAKHNDVS